MGGKLKKSVWMISRSFGWENPPGLRLMTRTCSTSGWLRHSSRTPSPTIPVAPVMIALVFIHCVLPTSAGPPRARLAIGLLQPHENHRPNHRPRTCPLLEEEKPSAYFRVALRIDPSRTHHTSSESCR